MRALGLFAAGAAVLLGGCETAFVGDAPGGQYRLVEVNGMALPAVPDPRNHCPVTYESGRFDLDSVARRFEMVLERRGPCIGSGRDQAREAGSYLRRGGRLTLESPAPGGGAPRTLIASEAGDVISFTYDGLRLRFRQAAPPRR